MSMLAERRRKTKWVINPTKKPLWTQDSGGLEFGKKLMEKMGWSAGKGLGLKEQGIEEPLKVSYKNDTKGMGFKGHDDDWIEHQDEFNMLLSQLSNNDTAVEENSEIEKPKVKSLELKSKHSRARVHYQKFTRGKDLSNYSEKDLACILGLNKTKEDKSKCESDIKTESKSEYETSFGVTTINGGSIENYFKKKYAFDKIKSSSSCKNNEATENPGENVTNRKSDLPKIEESNEEPYAEEKKHKKRKRRMEADNITYENTHDGSEEQKCKKKKTSKSKDIENLEAEAENDSQDEKCKKKKTSKSKDIENLEAEAENDSQEHNYKKKKASKSKEKPSEIDETEKSQPDNVIYETIVNDNEEHKCKKRKKSKCKENTEESGVDMSYESTKKESDDREGKKRKKTKVSEAENVNNESIEKENKREKKKKASKTKEDNGNSEAKADDVNENMSEEPKCKKKKTSKSKVEKASETDKCEVIETETSKEENVRSETNFEERKIKKKKRREKIDANERGEDIEGTHCPPVDESLPAVLKEKNTKNEEKKSKHEKHKLKSEPEVMASPSVEHEPSSLPKEKKPKKKKHKSDMAVNENEADPPGEKDETGKSELGELGDILEAKYETKRKGQGSVETNEEPIGKVVVDESNSKVMSATVSNGEATVNERRFTSEKVLDLIQWANIKEFRGSNLKNVLGYGVKKEISKNKKT